MYTSYYRFYLEYGNVKESIPSFAGNLGRLALDASRNTAVNTIDSGELPNMPKPSMNSFKAFMESPLTPRSLCDGS